MVNLFDPDAPPTFALKIEVKKVRVVKKIGLVRIIFMNGIGILLSYLSNINKTTLNDTTIFIFFWEVKR